ncbi:MAG TPA: EpsG family protein [Paraburkholderia sp.]|nr:EpsG family protein [Paraburkholderia sp.]
MMRALLSGTTKWNAREYFGLAMILATVMAVVYPFGLLYSFLLFLGLAASVQRPARLSVFLLCVGAVVVLGPLVALKLPIQDGGNDKLQYLEFMRTMHASGVEQYLARQPEFLSFASLYIASSFEGSTDMAFLLIFVTFFSALLIVMWRERYEAIPVFLILLISSSSFFGTYGNVIRQAMAFPFMFMMIFARTRTRSTLFTALAGVTHIPSLIICVPYLLYRYMGKHAIWAAFAATGGVLLVSKASPGLLASFGNDDSYLSTKVNLYSTWDAYSIVGVATLAAGIFLLANMLWWRKRTAESPGVAGTQQAAQRCLTTLNFAALALIATYAFPKVFERIYIYFFVVALMYMSLMTVQMRRGLAKTLVSFAIVAYGIYGLAKNLDIQPLLYEGNPIGFLTASIFDLYRPFM